MVMRPSVRSATSSAQRSAAIPQGNGAGTTVETRYSSLYWAATGAAPRIATAVAAAMSDLTSFIVFSSLVLLTTLRVVSASGRGNGQAERLCRIDDLFMRHPRLVFERGCVGNRNAWRAEPLHRRLQAVMQLLRDRRRDLGAEAGHRDRLMRHDQPPGLLHRGEYAVAIPGPERTQINDFRIDPLLLQRLRCRDAGMARGRPGHEREIAPLANDLGLSERHQMLAVGHHAFERPEMLVFEIDHRIVIADGALQQAEIIRRRRRGDDHEAGNMRVPGFERLRVLRCRGAPHPHRLAHHHRDAHLPAEHEARLRRLVDEFVDGAQGEIRKPHLDDGPRPRHRRTHRSAHDAGFRDGRIGDARGTEFVDQPLVLPEHATAPEIFAERPDARVALHFLAYRALAGFEIADRVHEKALTCGSPQSCTSRQAPATSGQAVSRAVAY